MAVQVVPGWSCGAVRTRLLSSGCFPAPASSASSPLPVFRFCGCAGGPLLELAWLCGFGAYPILGPWPGHSCSVGLRLGWASRRGWWAPTGPRKLLKQKLCLGVGQPP